MKNARSLLLKGALWMVFSRLLINGVSLLSTIALARLLLPSDFGLVAIASAIAMIFALITELSLSQALVQHDDPTEEHYHTAFTLNLIRAVVLAAFVGILAWPIAQLYDDPRLFPIIISLAIGTFAGGLINPKLARFERDLDFRQLVTVSFAEKLAGSLIAIGLALIWRSYWALVIGQIASQVARTAASYMLIRYRPRLMLGKARDLISFSVWLTLGQMVQAVNWRSDPLILGYFLNTRTVGHFTMAGRISEMITGDLMQQILRVVFPALSKLKHEAERFRRAYLTSQSMFCLIAFPIAAGLFALANPLVVLVLGAKWEPVVPVLQVLAIGSIAQRSNNVNFLAMALGQTKALFGRDIRALFIRLPLITGGLYVLPQYGFTALQGALIGILAATTINQSLNIVLIARISTISLLDQLSIIFRPLLACLGMVVLLGIVMDSLPEQSSIANQIFALMALAAAGAASYVMLIGALWLISGRPNGAEKEIYSTAMSMFGQLRRRFG
jgi:PST family polysaccharide transporter